MATTTKQPKLHRCFQTGILAVLIFFCFITASLFLGQTGGEAYASENEIPFAGQQFFLLSDATYGSDGMAFVRLEAPGREKGYLEKYSGVDIVVYRVPEPLTFLGKQKNLHRIEIKGHYKGEGLANALRYLWDSWNRKARYVWQRLFSTVARKAVTEQAPELKRHPGMGKPTSLETNPQFEPLPGFELVDRFRYPLWQAKPIEPPKNVALAGSSSEFISVSEGNVMVPIGKRKPGLYLVEAIIGSFRATTLIFVSDTLALVKNSSDQLMVWTAHRQTGRAVNGVNIVWTDGVGKLQSGKTAKDGIVVFQHKSPEHTYVVGQDSAGGVFVSENFYYDSEIYNAKIYAFTDRPLYRPGDIVHVKFVGRQFKDARTSTQLKEGDLSVTVIDPNGTPIATKKLKITAEYGADTSFSLPGNSVPGGYDLRFEYQGDMYGAAFRVAEYVKPHYEINIVVSKPEFKTNEPVTGKILLVYPDGKPVKGATVQMTVKSQQLTMVESELQYYGQFPIKLETEEIAVDSTGSATFTLPAAKQPSRYILTLLANDQAAYRVKATKEILIEQGATLYSLTAPRHFTSPGEKIIFSFQPQGNGGTYPSRWEMVHLETQKKATGMLTPGSNQWPVTFSESGSYTLMLRDDKGNLLAAASHWVAGEGLKATPGSIEIVFDKDKYQPGDTAHALITFPEPVEEALLTLERDRVEKHALLSGNASWLHLKQIGATQWRADIPVADVYSPNITFSVLYSLHGDYTFQNRGLQVEQKSVKLLFKTDKEIYLPGERVQVEVSSVVDGKPVETNLTISVVDEMVYVLQPEIAPNLFQFFYHPRRNNVRTSSSLSFISYDMALSALPSPPARNNNERSLKVLERPRRDNIDTAAWVPNLKTNRNGKASFFFIMPDALTRWRITGRAMTVNGIVGQKAAWFQSSKPLYLKWTGPTRFRTGDGPIIDIVAFNQTRDALTADFSASGTGLSVNKKIDLKPGPTYISLPVIKTQQGEVTLQLNHGNKIVDILKTQIQVSPVEWLSPRSEMISVNKTKIPLRLPADARNVRVVFADRGAAQFSRIVDDLIDYPWGCVEQTASRMIPLSLAYQTMSGLSHEGTRERMALTLQTNRLRLIQMAGPDAVFGWWGQATTGSALWTAYAYYADWHASRVLNISLPQDHWSRVIEAYKKHSENEPLLYRALTVWFAGEMGLPIKTMLDGLQDEIKDISGTRVSPPRVGTSPIIAEPESTLGKQIAVVLIAHMATEQNQKLKPLVANQLRQARVALQGSGLPVCRALTLMESKKKDEKETNNILDEVRQEMPTFDRSITLVWLQKALGAIPSGRPVDVALQGDWQMSSTGTGNPVWYYTGKDGKPSALNLDYKVPGPFTAIVRYDSSIEERSMLPVTIERKLYRLKTGSKLLEFDSEPVQPEAILSSKDLYIEEITLSPKEKKRISFGILEVPLPPGADVERTTWGMQIRKNGTGEYRAMEKARHETGQLSYAIAVDALDGPLTFRHLLRFSQKGTFNLPPARFFRMYQPEEKAFEGEGKIKRVTKVQ